jgi:hypothetical protein
MPSAYQMKTMLHALWTMGALASFVAAGVRDMNVCQALQNSTELSNHKVDVTGWLLGDFYHGFAIFGREGMQPCSKSMLRWFQTDLAVGAMALDFTSSEESAHAIA